MLAVVLILSSLVQYGFANDCNQNEESEYTREYLEEECRTNLPLLNFNNPSLKMDNKILEPLCTSSCLGRYAKWLTHTCNNTKKAMLITASCLRQEDSNSELKRCRFFFPDFADISSTHQCAQYLMNSDCLQTCKEPLKKFVMELGCCFQAIYNNEMVVESLHEQGFFNTTQFVALKLFHMSDLLENCLDTHMAPPACSSQPFLSSDKNTSAARGTVPHIFSFCIAFFMTLLFSLPHS